MVHHFREK